jgi:hypothetical protein
MSQRVKFLEIRDEGICRFLLPTNSLICESLTILRAQHNPSRFMHRQPAT